MVDKGTPRSHLLSCPDIKCAGHFRYQGTRAGDSHNCLLLGLLYTINRGKRECVYIGWGQGFPKCRRSPLYERLHGISTMNPETAQGAEDALAFQKISNFPMVDLREDFTLGDLLHSIRILKELYNTNLIQLTHHKIMA